MTDVVERQEQEAAERWLRGWLEGPTRTRHETVPVQPGDPAPDLTLPDSSGSPRSLSEFWADGPAVVIFFRHYGCGCLAERWDQLSSEVEEFQTAGATVVAIGQAPPERTAVITERRGYGIPVLADPELTAYAAYGLLQGTPATILHDHPFSPGDEETGRGWQDGRAASEKALVDDPWQLPGEFVISAEGTIVLTHRYQYCEDFPPKTVLLGAIAAAR